MNRKLTAAAIGILAVVPLAACQTPASSGSSSTPAPGVTAGQHVILSYAGHGNGSTPGFTLPTSGDYDVYWSFTGNGTGQFNIAEGGVIQQVGGDGFANMLTAPDGSGSTEVSGGPGAASLQVTASPTCRWTITVTSMTP